MLCFWVLVHGAFHQQYDLVGVRTKFLFGRLLVQALKDPTARARPVCVLRERISLARTSDSRAMVAGSGICSLRIRTVCEWQRRALPRVIVVRGNADRDQWRDTRRTPAMPHHEVSCHTTRGCRHRAHINPPGRMTSGARKDADEHGSAERPFGLRGLSSFALPHAVPRCRRLRYQTQKSKREEQSPSKGINRASENAS